MTSPVVYVVDDDAGVRDSLSFLFYSAGLDCQCFESAESFCAAHRLDRPACVILDVHMDGTSGLDLQEELLRRGAHLPIIFLTARADIATTVHAMKNGATDVLTKPVDSGMLLARVRTALDASAREYERHARLAHLTEREREVLILAIAGSSNKQIARRLGISHRTVEVHRSHILAKTGADSLLELAHLLASE